MPVVRLIFCIALLQSINVGSAQSKGTFIFFDEHSKEPFVPYFTGFIKGEDVELKAYDERQVKDGILFFVQDFPLFHRNGMQKKEVGAEFLKGEKILNATKVAEFLSGVHDKKNKELGYPIVLEFIYRPDPPMYIVKKTQDGYLLYEVEWEEDGSIH